MPALQQFFEAERLRQGWSMREAAMRCKISPSKAYAIANGDDNVELETFENIATAFNMSPAELHVAIGKGPAHEDPELAPTIAVLRRVSPESRGFADRLLRQLLPDHDDKPRPRGKAHAARPNPKTHSGRDDSDLDNTQTVRWASAQPVFA